ncbi:MAG: hypothetical protein IIZ61_07830 [Lachnospiraceae bacterium]|nr:hypothetical protein [Lachnospiraceae bacterium]
MDSIGNVGRSYAAYNATKQNSADKAATSGAATQAGGFSEEAAVYEPSKNAKGLDRDAIIAQMKSDVETRMNKLTDMVRDTMQQQGATLGNADDIWKFLADGKFKNVDEAAVEQAKKDISEDGYWGVDKTSSRIVDFAIAISGDDTEKADKLIEAFEKGYKEATKSWGKELPSISSDTRDAVLEKFDQWKNGTYGKETEV